jgi:hypothetical protein
VPGSTRYMGRPATAAAPAASYAPAGGVTAGPFVPAAATVVGYTPAPVYAAPAAQPVQWASPSSQGCQCRCGKRCPTCGR